MGILKVNYCITTNTIFPGIVPMATNNFKSLLLGALLEGVYNLMADTIKFSKWHAVYNYLSR